MNLELIISNAINTVVPKIPISLYIFNSDSVDDSGSITTTYNIITNIIAQVQLENTQKIQHRAYFNSNSVYKRFYIQSTNLTGLNRNLSTAGDYILMQNLYYKIVELPENFQVGWVQVIGCESNDLVIG